MNTSTNQGHKLQVNAINTQKSVSYMGRDVISPSLSALLLNSKVASKASQKSSERQYQINEKNFSQAITEIKNQNSAKSAIIASSNFGPQMSQIQLKKIQSLILCQKSKLVASKSGQVGTEMSNTSKFQNIQHLLGLLNSKKVGIQDHSKISKPQPVKHISSINENCENQEPLSVNVKLSQKTGSNLSYSKTFMNQPVSLGNTNSNILQPSLLGNPRFQENLANIMNSRRIFDNIQKPGSNLARNSKLQIYNAASLASPSECSVSQTNNLMSALKKRAQEDCKGQSSVKMMGFGLGKPQLQTKLNSPSELSRNSTMSLVSSKLSPPSIKPDSLKLQQLNMSQLQLLLKDYSSSSIGLRQSTPVESPFGTQENQVQEEQQEDQPQSITVADMTIQKAQNQSKGKALGKRKRKTERELKILRSELKSNVMWTRESIKTMRQQYEKDFEMSEQQIYKWWWDQTRKRSKKASGKQMSPEQEALNIEKALRQDENGMLVSFQDEFGGYSSRLRLQQADKPCEQPEDLELANGAGVEINLCEMLGIDVEAIAYKLALSECNQIDEEDEEFEQMNYNSTANSSSRKQFACDLN